MAPIVERLHSPALRPHTAERERAILSRWADAASPSIATEVRSSLSAASDSWDCSTVVHRDLYEEQILLADQVGLIDLDDVAAGPAELDLGNLWAHVELLGMRVSLDLESVMGAFLDGYATCGPSVDDALLDRCRRLALRRLACIHDEERLLERGDVGATATLPEEAARAPDSPQ